ncbi:MAG: class I SAM-dependent methyltransferase [Candidatus Pacebacteria bacterium]|nr:class I SAM-dependent methyltransferase [Candidatus Paceibacterota bacterium]
MKENTEKFSVVFDEEREYFHLSPLPSHETLLAYYQNQFYGSNYQGQIQDSAPEVQKKDQDFLDTQYADIFDIIDSKSLGNKIIDIGCGFGNFLDYCQRKGYDSFGLDPSFQAIKEAEKYNLNVIQSNIENLKAVVTEEFHTAVLLDVLEHLIEPAIVLKNVKDILTDGGLLIVKVPNEFNTLQTIANQEYRLNEWWVTAPVHINYFSVKTIVNLIEKNGFEVFLKESTFPLEMFILFGDQYVGHPEIGKIIHSKRVLFEQTLAKHNNKFKRKLFQSFAELEIGREIIIYACKK